MESGYLDTRKCSYSVSGRDSAAKFNILLISVLNQSIQQPLGLLSTIGTEQHSARLFPKLTKQNTRVGQIRRKQATFQTLTFIDWSRIVSAVMLTYSKNKETHD